MKFETGNQLSPTTGPAPENSAPKLDFRVSPPGSRVPHQKLVMLILSLILVIYAMLEAGKPERWHWLIPPEPTETQRLDDQAPAGLEIEGADATPEPFPESETTIGSPPLNSELKFPALDSDDYPDSARQFWANLFRRLSPQQRMNLFLLLKRIRHHQPTDATSELQGQFARLVEAIHSQRLQFHQELLQELTYTTEGAQKKSLLANALYEAQTRWDRGEKLAISAYLVGDRLDDAQQQQLQQLQQILDPLIFGFVVDKSAQGWEGDSPAWARMWEKIKHEELAPPIPTSHLELSAQPETYRGRSVQVQGWVRGAWRETLPIAELGIESLYVLAVRPADSKVTPFFLYARELPVDFPSVSKKYTALNRRIVADGLFFKIRNYRDTERNVRESPMILVHSVRSIAEAAGLPRSDVAVLRNPVWIVGGLLGLTTLALGVAWLAFSTTKSYRFRPGPNRTRQIHGDLDQLLNDPEIKTPQQRVQDLYE